jgi:hypothetical protein
MSDFEIKPNDAIVLFLSDISEPCRVNKINKNIIELQSIKKTKITTFKTSIFLDRAKKLNTFCDGTSIFLYKP